MDLLQKKLRQVENIDDLFFILEKEKLADIYRIKSLSSQAKRFLKSYIKTIPIAKTQHVKSKSFYEAITQASTPIYFLGVMLTTVSLAFSSLIAVTALMLSLLIFGITTHIIGSYQKIKLETKEDKEIMRHMHLRLMIMREIIRRLTLTLAKKKIPNHPYRIQSKLIAVQTPKSKRHFNIKIKKSLRLLRLMRVFKAAKRSELNNSLENTVEVKDYKPKHKRKRKPDIWMPRFKDSFGSSLICGIILFESYYISSVALAKALSIAVATTILTGPIMFWVTLSITILISCYLGYKVYQHAKEKDLANDKQSLLIDSIKNQYSECNRLRDLLNNYHRCHPHTTSKPKHLNHEKSKARNNENLPYLPQFSLFSNKSSSNLRQPALNAAYTQHSRRHHISFRVK